VLKVLAQAKRSHILRNPSFFLSQTEVRSDKELKAMHLSNTAVTNAGLLLLKGLAASESLWLHSTRPADHVGGVTGFRPWISRAAAGVGGDCRGCR
jgi:hypothetical protein